MKRPFIYLASTILLCSCSSVADDTVTLDIQPQAIIMEQGNFSHGELTIQVANHSQKSQTIKVQGLQINYVSEPLADQKSTELHFSLPTAKGNLIITSTDSDNHTLTTTLSIH